MKINNAKTIKVLAVILAMAFGIGSVMSHTILSETGRTVSLAAEANVVAQNAAPAQAEAKKMEREPQSGGFSSSDYTISKEETVYVTANPDGTTNQISVSDWLKNSGTNSGALLDKTDLTNIENVKGDETFLQDGQTLVWNTANADIYYQGSTTQKLPVDMQITYYLNGEEIAPSALAGKNGHLKMVVSFKNHAKVKKEIDGKQQTLYSPFVTVTGMMLPVDHFSNVTVDNGKCISDGSRDIVLGYAMPGMRKNLGLKKDLASQLPISNSFTVEADVTDFELSGTYTTAISDFFQNMEFGGVDTLDDLKDALSQLDDAATQLMDGSGELYDGTHQLSEKYQEFADGLSSLSDGIEKLSDGCRIHGERNLHVCVYSSLKLSETSYSADKCNPAVGSRIFYSQNRIQYIILKK